MTHIRLIIKDESGKIVPNAQIHVLEEVWRQSDEGGMNLVEDYYYKGNLFWYASRGNEGVPTENPLLCDSEGMSPSLVKYRNKK